jgi:hypothetical protein
LLLASSVARKTPAPDPALVARLSRIISALEEERRNLTGRLAAIDKELSQLASVIASHEDLRNALPPR